MRFVTTFESLERSEVSIQKQILLPKIPKPNSSLLMLELKISQKFIQVITFAEPSLEKKSENMLQISYEYGPLG